MRRAPGDARLDAEIRFVSVQVVAGPAAHLGAPTARQVEVAAGAEPHVVEALADRDEGRQLAVVEEPERLVGRPERDEPAGLRIPQDVLFDW